LGAEVKYLMVVVNREQGGKENLEKLGYKVHALAKVSDVVNSLQKTGKISAEQAKTVQDYIKK
jgi:orotate phosphoribosyltransferase